jgi:hypothetical protein
MTQQLSEVDLALWRRFVEAQAASLSARGELFTKGTSLPALIERGLHVPGDREAAQEAALLFKPRERPPAPREPSPPDETLWRHFVQAHNEARQARQAFLMRTRDRAAVVRRGLSTAGERTAALEVAPLLSVAERQQLFEELLALAGYFHGQAGAAREIILSLPRAWLLANIEPHAERLLRDGTYEEYRLLFELYIKIDRDLAARLARRAATQPDEDIREAGEDFLLRLGTA